GPAYNASDADVLLSQLQNRNSAVNNVGSDAMRLTMQNHRADPIGRFIGGNPATGGTIPEGGSFVKELFRALSGKKDTSHNCYGILRGKNNCGPLWEDSGRSIPRSVPIERRGE